MKIENTIQQVLVPLDFSETGEKALSIAKMLAVSTQSKLHLLHVNVPQATTMHAAYVAVPPVITTPPREDLLKRLKEVDTSQLPDSQVHCAIVEESNISAAIVDYAEKNNIDIIVMTTHGHTGLARLVMGSVAETVVRTAKCPVVTYKG